MVSRYKNQNRSMFDGQFEALKLFPPQDKNQMTSETKDGGVIVVVECRGFPNAYLFISLWSEISTGLLTCQRIVPRRSPSLWQRAWHEVRQSLSMQCLRPCRALGKFL